MLVVVFREQNVVLALGSEQEVTATTAKWLRAREHWLLLQGLE